MPTVKTRQRCAILSVKVTKPASSPHSAAVHRGGCDTLQPDCEKKGLHLQCTPTATALSRRSVHLDRPAKRPGVTTSRIARGNLRSVLPTPPRSVAPLSAKARTDTPSPTHTADETGRKHAPLHAFVGHFVSARHFLSPFAAHGRTIPRCPAAFNAFHHVHSPPLIVFFRRRPLRIRTRRCPCGRTCAVFYQNRCTFFQ